MQRKEKKHPEKKDPSQEIMEKFFKKFEENEMIDDHGPAIIGRRDKKPTLPEEPERD